jgi:hypothetical protein
MAARPITRRSAHLDEASRPMTQAQPEPSMEEILASIRRIISDDGEEEAAPAPTTRARPTPVAIEPAPPAAEPVRPSFLKREEPATPGPAKIDEDRAGTHLKTEDVEMIKRAAVEADVVVDDVAANAAAKAFQSLSQTVRISSHSEGRTIEDIVVEIMRPMIKQWLDDNLAHIVSEKVEAEVQRVARLRR